MTDKQKDSENPADALACAVERLRRHQGVMIGEKCVIAPAESIDNSLFSTLLPYTPRLLITGARARSLGLSPQGTAISLDVSHLSADAVRALADPTLENAPSVTAFSETSDLAPLLALTKRAGLLPALIVADTVRDGWPVLTMDTLKAALANHDERVTQTARAHLPLAGAEEATITSFRSEGSDAVHLALLIGNPGDDGEPPLVRVHSSCVTGDLLGSLRCDCGGQLQLALEAIKTEGRGVLLYLNQEGRGIGITNKLRAYQLQESGIDTFDANLMLGFDEDERDFSVAAAILKALRIPRVRLLSNNPHKVDALAQCGVTVTTRLPLVAPPGEHNHAYIAAKTHKGGHIF